MKVSTEYDSENNVFVNKISAQVFNGLAKLKASFQREASGEFRYPLLGVVTKYLSVLYDHEDRNALVTVSAHTGRNLRLQYSRDIKAQQGELKMFANSADLKYKSEITCDLPPAGLPKAVLSFPNGEIKIEDDMSKEENEKALSISGFLGGSALHGLLVAEYRDENLNFKYTFKDEEMTLTPQISWPSKTLSVAFKRQFTPASKLSYVYNFDSTAWSAVLKHKPNEDFKVKLGYDSEVRLCWGSLWVGKEDFGAKQAPRKCKLQLMVQVPQDNVKEAIVLFRVKKRWDI